MKSSRILIIYSFIVTLVLTVVGILSAKDTNQLLTSLIYLPLIFYFGTRILGFKKKSVKKVVKMPKVSALQTIPFADQSMENPEIIRGVADKDKRLFLKLIGSSGITLLLMALFTKKAQAAFFGSVPGPGVVGVKDIAGNKINPAEKNPTDGFEITNIDDTGSPAYYGFLHSTGSWYIMNENSSGEYRYVKGASSFSTNWTNRASLTYDYFDSVF